MWPGRSMECTAAERAAREEEEGKRERERDSKLQVEVEEVEDWVIRYALKSFLYGHNPYNRSPHLQRPCMQLFSSKNPPPSASTSFEVVGSVTHFVSSLRHSLPDLETGRVPSLTFIINLNRLLPHTFFLKWLKKIV